MIKRKTKSFFLKLILIALAISPAFALGEGNRNLLLIGIMALSPILILNYGRLDRKNIWLILFMGSIIVFPLVHQPQSMRWSTVLYSVMFCLTFLAYQGLLHRSYFTPKKYLQLLKFLILAYFIVLVIQQLCVIAGLPIFNVSNYNPSDPWKLNALAAEPSHSARIVALLMYCYIIIKELVINRKYNFREDIKKDKWVWLAFIWTMVTMGSGTAFLFLAIVLLKFIRFKNLIPVFVLTAGILVLVSLFEISAVERTTKTVVATLTLDEATIIEADHSASFRIVPLIVLAKKMDFATLNFWFGHGVDQVKTFMYLHIPGGGDEVAGGGLLAMAYEFGYISFILFCIFSYKVCFSQKDFLFPFIFWFLLVFMNGINSQIVWLCIILLFTNRHFLKPQRLN